MRKQGGGVGVGRWEVRKKGGAKGKGVEDWRSESRGC